MVAVIGYPKCDEALAEKTAAEGRHTTVRLNIRNLAMHGFILPALPRCDTATGEDAEDESLDLSSSGLVALMFRFLLTLMDPAGEPARLLRDCGLQPTQCSPKEEEQQQPTTCVSYSTPPAVVRGVIEGVDTLAKRFGAIWFGDAHQSSAERPPLSESPTFPPDSQVNPRTCTALGQRELSPAVFSEMGPGALAAVRVIEDGVHSLSACGEGGTNDSWWPDALALFPALEHFFRLAYCKLNRSREEGKPHHIENDESLSDVQLAQDDVLYYIFDEVLDPFLAEPLRTTAVVEEGRAHGGTERTEKKKNLLWATAKGENLRSHWVSLLLSPCGWCLRDSLVHSKLPPSHLCRGGTSLPYFLQLLVDTVLYVEGRIQQGQSNGDTDSTPFLFGEVWPKDAFPAFLPPVRCFAGLADLEGRLRDELTNLLPPHPEEGEQSNRAGTVEGADMERWIYEHYLPNEGVKDRTDDGKGMYITLRVSGVERGKVKGATATAGNPTNDLRSLRLALNGKGVQIDELANFLRQSLRDCATTQSCLQFFQALAGAGNPETGPANLLLGHNSTTATGQLQLLLAVTSLLNECFVLSQDYLVGNLWKKIASRTARTPQRKTFAMVWFCYPLILQCLLLLVQHLRTLLATVIAARQPPEATTKEIQQVHQLATHLLSCSSPSGTSPTNPCHIIPGAIVFLIEKKEQRGEGKPSISRRTQPPA